MLGGRERGGGMNRFQHLLPLLKAFQLIMSKRTRSTERRRERGYRNKRRRISSLSPSRGRPNDIDVETHIRILEMNIDILRAQLKIIRKELYDLRQPSPTGQKNENSVCLLM